MEFNKVLDKYRKKAFSERDKGDRFERLMQTYLQTDPKYSSTLKYVWMWNEFPGKKDFGGKDIGIDLVAMTFEGDYWAIQCKCFAEEATIDKKSLDSFLSTSSKTFLNDQLQTTSFANRLWISTTNKWGLTAEETIRNQNPPVTRLNLYDLQSAPVDWEKLDQGISGDLARTTKKTLFQHQEVAKDETNDYFKTHDRGKLIMACGTGKTFTSLRIAENETGGKGVVLFMVPSIALLGQSLREWTADALEPIHPICICSDSKITRAQALNDESDSTSVVDLAMPATTKVVNVVKQFRQLSLLKRDGMIVVFSTYQSIEVISEAQKVLLKENNPFAEFDLVICDEAHRTTGVTLSEDDESSFVKIHKDENIKAKKRLYMTATPRLYGDDSKQKAAQTDAVLCSMDDKKIYGEEIYRIGFGEAVDRGLLTDYKVLVLTLSEKDIPEAVQRMVANKDMEINSDDASKLIGCLNAMSKQILGDEGVLTSVDPEPMKKAVAFCQNIKVSQKITGIWNSTSDIYLDSVAPGLREKLVSISANHIDGSMNAPKRDELLGWLKSTAADSNECRVLTNVRCLSEGVDVPTLDSVLFLSARNSQVDVVQSVGRVMRRSPGKKYGYIIIPVVVPSDIPPEEALEDNQRFKVVWSVLNALRAHDDRFNATINKIDLNKNKPSRILIGGLPSTVGEGNPPKYGDINAQLAMQFEQLQSVMYAKMVQKVGDKVYWEKWANDVAQIASNQRGRIKTMIENNTKHHEAFERFLEGLQKNINPSIERDEAIEMLSQHIITKPVFEALFEGYSFVKNNPISTAMQSMLDLLEDEAVEKDTETLDKFYESVKMRAAGIDNAEGKQRIIIELYDKFFKTAFPKMVEQLGIVYTPVEVVDFIIHSVNDILKKEFNCALTDENIHILDPFTGTGTFITRLLQSGLIDKKDAQRKFRHELHANEIVLLAYYIAAVNIESAYHDILEEDSEYEPFEGICLTDTFQLGEIEDSVLFSEMFPKNSERLEAQKKGPIRVIIGNPPYSVGQKSANDDAQNQSYAKLEERIRVTYAQNNSSGSVKDIYDSYFKAFRWASDRLSEKNGGVVAFITNSGWIDKGFARGFRQSLQKEFAKIYVFDLKGAIRGKAGELVKKEGQNVFDIMTGVAITFLIRKDEQMEKDKSQIFYAEIGDYLSRHEKLLSLKENKLDAIGWKVINPDKHYDWLNQTKDLFTTYLPVAPLKKFDFSTQSYFVSYSLGIASSRDSWVYNFSRAGLEKSLRNMMEFYNNQRMGFLNSALPKTEQSFKDYCSNDSTKISWNDSLRKKCAKNHEINFENQYLTTGMYRPFCRTNLYFVGDLIQRPYQQPRLFPSGKDNLVICIPGKGERRGFATFMTKSIPDLNMFDGGCQCFPRYIYVSSENVQGSLFDSREPAKRDGVSDFILTRAQSQYGKRVQKDDIFYYVYGLLHSTEYRDVFKNDLKKTLPHIPLVERVQTFWTFSEAGRKLSELHVNYETVPPFNGVFINGEQSESFRVTKMRFSKKGQKDSILYNGRITISNIPEKAYEYVINGKSAIEWVMERYQVKKDKDSGIVNDPNDWAAEVGNPRYILDLLLSVINVSVQTVDIVENLPKLEFE